MNKSCRTYSRAGRVQETPVVQASKLCRLCLSQNDDNNSSFVSIFDIKDEPLTSTMISFCTGLGCDETDGMPDKLCGKCYLYILDFYAFKKMCLASFDKLNKNIEISKELSKPKTVEPVDPLADPLLNNGEDDPLIDLHTKKEDSEDVFVLGISNVHPDAPDEVMVTCRKSVEDLSDSGTSRDGENREALDKRLQCCGIHFLDLIALSNHHREFHKMMRYYCDICMKGFKTKSAVVRHLPVHTGDRPFKCETCGKGFSQKESLTRHLPTHTHRRFECEQCGKVLLSLEGLKCHVKTAHTPRTPEDLSKYKCKWCHKVFMHASGLSRHSALHNGVRYFCDACLRMFNDSSQLRRHIAKAHPSISSQVKSKVALTADGDARDADPR